MYLEYGFFCKKQYSWIIWEIYNIDITVTYSILLSISVIIGMRISLLKTIQISYTQYQLINNEDKIKLKAIKWEHTAYHEFYCNKAYNE